MAKAMALQLYWQSPPPWLAIVTRPGSVVVTRAPTINKIITAIHFNAPICPSFSHLCHLFTSTKWKSTPNKKSGLLFDNKEKEELVKGPTMTIKSSRYVSYKGGRVTTFGPDFSSSLNFSPASFLLDKPRSNIAASSVLLRKRDTKSLLLPSLVT